MRSGIGSPFNSLSSCNDRTRSRPGPDFLRPFRPREETGSFISTLSSRCRPGLRTPTAAAWRHSDEAFHDGLFWSAADDKHDRLLPVRPRMRLWSRLPLWWRCRRMCQRSLRCGSTRLPDGFQRRLPAGGLCPGNHNGPGGASAHILNGMQRNSPLPGPQGPVFPPDSAGVRRGVQGTTAGTPRLFRFAASQHRTS